MRSFACQQFATKSGHLTTHPLQGMSSEHHVNEDYIDQFMSKIQTDDDQVTNDDLVRTNQ
eukprot:SAG31_NODE_11617_length_1013_cov_0.782276_1_plen_59_part_10